MTRNILEEPRVTRFKIDWGGGPEANGEEEANGVGMDAEVAMDDHGTESSLMEPPLKNFNIHTESSHSTMEVV